MPGASRLQERLSAIEAAENAKRSIRSPAPSPVPSSSPSPPSSSIASSPPSLPPTRLPTRILNPRINIHGRRSPTHILHNFQGHIAATPFPDFPDPEAIYIPGAGEEEPSNGFSSGTCYVSVEEPEYLSSRQEYDECSDYDSPFLPDLPDHVSDEEQKYAYPSPPGASTAALPSSSPPDNYAQSFDIDPNVRGSKRKRQHEKGLLTGVEKFLDELPIGTTPTLRKKMIDSTLKSPSLGYLNAEPVIPAPVIPEALPPAATKPKVIPFSSIPTHPRAKDVLTRLRKTCLAQQHPKTTHLAPLLSPIVVLPERKCHFYTVYSNYHPDDPNWVPAWPVHEEWQGSVSPKISPTGNGTTLYAVGCRGRKRKFSEIKEKMNLERLLNLEPERKVKRVRLPSFRDVVTGIEWQRFHDHERERVRRGAAESYRKTAVPNAGMKKSVVRGPELFDPRWREGVNRAQLPNAFSSEIRR